MILATWYHPLLAVLFAFLAILLMAVILLQRGKGVGLSGAFGGAGGHTAFGAKTGDVLTWATIIIAAALLTFVILLNYVFRPLQAPGTTPTVAPAPVSTPISVPAESTPASEPATTTPKPPAEATPPAPATGDGEATPPSTDTGGGDAPTYGIFGESN